MTDPKYNEPAYRREKKRLRPIVERGEAWCSEPICLMRSRWIAPGTPWHLSHDRQTGGLLGPSHERCNTSEGGKEKHRRARRATRTRWIL